jgi:hypothetical protein
VRESGEKKGTLFDPCAKSLTHHPYPISFIF